MLDLERDVQREIVDALRTAPTTWLGTVRPDGRPHLVPVWFYWDGETVLILTRPGDQKVKNLRQTPKATLGIPRSEDASSVVIVSGEAELLDRPSVEIAPPEFPEKYRASMDAYGWNWGGLLQENSQPIVVRPTKVDAW